MQVLLFIVMIYHLQELAYVTHQCDSLFNVHVLRIEYYICTYYVQQVLSCNVLRKYRQNSLYEVHLTVDGPEYTGGLWGITVSY